MAANTAPIFPKAPIIGVASLVSPTAITSRANITGVTGLTKLTDASAEGLKIPMISVKATATSVATQLFIWVYNGTTSYLLDEIAIPVQTASNTAESVFIAKNYELQNGASIVLQPTFQIYVSVSVAQNLNVFAHGGIY